MPIEIKELHIRVAVNTQASDAGGSAGPEALQSPKTGEANAGKEEIVADCVERVLEILQNKTER